MTLGSSPEVREQLKGNIGRSADRSSPHWPESMRKTFSLEECDSLVAEGEVSDTDLKTRSCSGSRDRHQRRALVASPRPSGAAAGKNQLRRRDKNPTASFSAASSRRQRTAASPWPDLTCRVKRYRSPPPPSAAGPQGGCQKSGSDSSQWGRRTLQGGVVCSVY